ncbi:MAG TPA: hypothetical protein VGA00_06125 [Acidiferrobacterales bacterium]|jgi:hypothetical protein
MPMTPDPNRRSTAGARLAAPLGVALMLLAAPAGARDAAQSVDAETGIESWEAAHHGVYIKLMQITPGQALAFYLARGFDAAPANRFAGACVFMTLLRNDAAPGPVAFDLRDWRLIQGGTERPLTQRDDWLAEWKRTGVPEPARVAFHWAQFPTRHTYERGDWNQGMHSYGGAPGDRFNLKLVWKADERTYRTVLRDLRCAPDDR